MVSSIFALRFIYFVDILLSSTNNNCRTFTILAEIHCGPLNAPSHGSKQGNNDVVDSVVTFSCNRGYRLQESEKRTCTTQGTWDGVNAKCVGQS